MSSDPTPADRPETLAVATEKPVQSPPRARNWAVPSLAVMSLIVVNLALFGAGFYVIEQRARQDQGEKLALTERVNALSARLAKLETAPNAAAPTAEAGPGRIDAVENRLQALEARQAAAPAPGAPDASGSASAPVLEALSARIAALEAKPGVPLPAETLAALDHRLGGLEITLNAGQTRLDAFDKDLNGSIKPALANLSQSVLERAPAADLQSALGRLAVLEAVDARQPVKSAAAALAISLLSEAVRAGQPYDETFQVTGRLTGPSPQLDVLGRAASTGIPTVETLAGAFPAAARQARLAGESKEPGLMGALKRNLGELVSVRGPGASTDNALASIAKALRRDDLAQVLAASGGLDPKAHAALEPWLARVKLRQEAMAALQSLQTSSLRALAAQTSP